MESTHNQISKLSPGMLATSLILALILIVLIVIVQIWVFKYVWNAVLPDVFKLPKITTYQAIMILILLMFIRPSIVPVGMLQNCQ